MSEREDLAQKLETGSLSDSLRAALRAQVVKKVRREKPFRPASPLSELVASLICDYLKREEFQYSLNVFLGEAGMTSKALTEAELREKLHLPHTETSVLASVLSAYNQSLFHSHQIEKAVQTEGTDLDLQLQLLETQHQLKAEQQPKPPREQLLTLERECRERYQETLTREIAYIRNIEVSAARMEESRKFQESLRKIQSDYEVRWREKQEEFKARERETARLREAKERDFAAERTVHKLQVDTDYNSLQKKEVEIADSIGATLAQLKNQQATYTRLNEELESKKQETDQLKAAFERRCTEELQRLQKDFEESHFLERQQLAFDREETDRLRVSTEMGISTKRDTEVKLVSLSRELEVLKKTYQRAAEELRTCKCELKEAREHVWILSERAKRTGDLLTLKEMATESLKSELRTHKEAIERLKETTQRLQAQPQQSEAPTSEAQPAIHLGTSDYLLGFEAWKVERQSRWRELDSLEAQIKRKRQDVSTLPTEYYQDSYSRIVMPKKAMVQTNAAYQPGMKSLDNVEIRQEAAGVYLRADMERSTSTTSLKPGLSGRAKETASVAKPRLETIREEEKQESLPESRKEATTKSPRKGSEYSSKPFNPPNQPAVTSPKQPTPSQSPKQAPQPLPTPVVNDSITEDIVVDSGSSQGVGGNFLESESLEAPSARNSEEDLFF